MAVTLACPFSVNAQIFTLAPSLEQAPDQMTSRLFAALSVTLVPTGNAAEPELPTAALKPAGLDVTRPPPPGRARREVSVPQPYA